MVKNPPANAGDIKDICLIPGSKRTSGGGHDNLLQSFCLKNSMEDTPQGHKESDTTEATEHILVIISDLKMNITIKIKNTE